MSVAILFPRELTLTDLSTRWGLRSATGLAAFGLALAVACATTRPPVESDPLKRPVAERLGEETLRIRWPASFSQGPVTIFAAASPTS